MKKSILNLSITAATAIAIAACSSGSDVAGIGGSGYVSSGTVTGFGSIFVNGVEFETDSSTFSVDDDPNGTEDDLAIGMRVTVTGSVNADGVTGTATSVTFDDELQGPVGPITENADLTIKTFSVLGTTVQINSTSTNFDVTDSLAGTPFSYDNITDGNNVEISGYLDSAGVLQATRIELKEQMFIIDNSIVELKGTISNLVNTSFNLSGINVDASAADIDDLPGGLAEGAYVEVKGTCPDPTCATIEATRVEGESEGFDDDDEVELEGIITRYVDDGDFDVNGFPVDASSAQKEPASLLLQPDMLIEVEGTIVNGVLVASEVEQEGGDIKIAATVATTIDASAGSFDLEPLPGQTITVKIDTSTEIEDEIDDFDSAALLDNMNPGNYIIVEGYDDGTGVIIARNVKRRAPGDIKLQGIVTSATGTASSGVITILGVEFPVDTNTVFEDENDMPYADPDDFFS
ncbi:MAG: DUF5666 domain-containing protein, partial [Gammaproteobacteria bacterium]